MHGPRSFIYILLVLITSSHEHDQYIKLQELALSHLKNEWQFLPSAESISISRLEWLPPSVFSCFLLHLLLRLIISNNRLHFHASFSSFGSHKQAWLASTLILEHNSQQDIIFFGLIFSSIIIYNWIKENPKYGYENEEIHFQKEEK